MRQFGKSGHHRETASLGLFGESIVSIDSQHTEDLRQQIEMLKEQLVQAQKLTALGELVSTTTHEFNNVLTTIINYAKLGMRHKDNETREKAFDKILLASNRAAKITSTVLGLARNRKAGQEPTNLQELVENTLLLLEREMNKYRVSAGARGMCERQSDPADPAQLAD
jgi:C4-dicarboxylate-specific signal transduction histidine kinase